MNEEVLNKNKQSRYALENGYYWTCGNYMELFIDYEWLNGRVEADNRGQYYFTDEDCTMAYWQGDSHDPPYNR